MTPADTGPAGLALADPAGRSAAGAAERAKLRRVLGRTDAVLFLLSAMIVTDTIGTVATGGGQALTAVIALVVLAYLLVFPAFAWLRRREPGLDRPFLLPGGRPGATLATTAATGWSLLAAACLLWPGLGTARPDAHLPAGFAGQRGRFELLALAPVALIVAAATAYCLATRNRVTANHRREQ